jgi:hypothetical protein
MDRFVIDAVGKEAEAEAFQWLIRQAQARGSDAAIVVPGVDSIRNLGRVLGSNSAAHVSKQRFFVLNGVTVHVWTPRTQPHSFDGPVLVPWASTTMVEDAERLGPPAICATGWTDGGLEDWKQVWAPIDPRTGEPDGVTAEPPAAVLGAILSMTSHISDDVLHPTDKKQAANAFKALHLLGIPVEAGLVRTLAISQGWTPDAAGRLADIAGKIAAGRAVRGGDRMTQTKAKELAAYFEQEVQRQADGRRE